MANPGLTLLWLRRDLRLSDHAALYHALQSAQPVQPVFIFDSDILADFPDAHDRRLSFIAQALGQIHHALKQRGGGLLVLHGRAVEILPELALALGAQQITASEDYEPQTRKRDAALVKNLPEQTDATFVKDQVIFAPLELLRNGQPYKVFTPYAHSWRAAFTPVDAAPYTIADQGRYAGYAHGAAQARHHGLSVLDPRDTGAMLRAIGYHAVEEPLWPVGNAAERLKHFMHSHVKDYGNTRNMVAQDATSRLSPYIRFGLLSVRQCVRAALAAGADSWLNELIWREFFAMNLYHVPESATLEWNPKYRHALQWSHNATYFKAWQEGKTGYPLVDAAMRQLLREGWMHNRARMVVASFLTKHLRIDWRQGEAHFGQYLMDYDLASNVGNWQWAASTGADAQPWFRIFNPLLQSEKFDPDGDYIRRYVPELARVRGKAIHAPWNYGMAEHYYPPIVQHEEARAQALAMFKAIK